jgi:phenylalanine-4-hydroxylase
LFEGTGAILLRGTRRKAMVQTRDPPSDEQKYAKFWNRVRGTFRKLVNRQTLMIAICTLRFVVQVVDILMRLFGGF